MKKIFLVITIILIAMGMTGCGNKERIVIYSSMEEERNQDLIKMLEEKFSDKEIDVQAIATGNNAAKIKAEGKNVEADIILGLELAHMENLKDNFADLSNYDTSHYIANINPKHNKYLLWEKYTASIIIDKTYFDEHQLSIPKSYDDLLKKEYEGLIAMPNPKTSGTGYMYVLNVFNIYGEDKALEYFDNLSKNVKQFTTSGSGPMNLLKQGEIAIAMGMTYQGVSEINNGANYELIEFETGTPHNFAGVSIIDGKQNKNGIKEIFDFLINDAMYHDREYYVPGEIVKNQKNSIKNFPTDLKDADMHDIESIEKKNEIIEKWKY